MKVLIIDDEDDIRSIASMCLSMLGGIDVIEAEDGATGIEKAAENNPDAILLDMMMPEMDGPTTLKKLKENPSTKHIPVIFLTARALSSEEEKLKSLGATGVLAKPFDPKALATQVRSILGVQ